MATKKKLLQAAAGSAGGAGPLNAEDLFSSYLYNGNGSSQIIENTINLGQSYGSSGMYFPNGNGDYLATASLPQFTGAFTYELWFYSFASDRAIYLIDKNDRDSNFSIVTNYLTTFDQMFVRIAGTLLNYSSVGFDPDGWNHVAVVRDSSNNVATFVNGTRVTTTSVVSGTVNAGAYYIGSNSSGTGASGYELMYGYMSSVRISDTDRYSTSSTSITTPTSEFTSDSNTVLLLGQGSTPLEDASSNSYNITVNGNVRVSEVGPYDANTSGEGGLVWIKERSSVENHFLTDTERGATKTIRSNNSNTQTTDAGAVKSFASKGFEIGNDGSVNQSGQEYVSWTWRKAPRYFDIVTYTGNSTNRTISHNLGSTPGMIMVKRTSSAGDWCVYHRGVNGGTNPEQYHLHLNNTNSQSAISSFWNDTAPTDSVFSVGTDDDTNKTGETYVAYLFAHNDGDGAFGVNEDQDIIKCGTYTGNGGSQEIDIGFEPQWIIIKNIDNPADWVIFDSMINWRRDNGQASYDSTALEANTGDAESSGTFARCHPSATGFGFKSEAGNWVNSSGYKYIYMAVRRGLMSTPEDATKVFAIDQENSSAPYYTSNFPVDFAFMRRTSVNSNSFGVSRLTQGREVYLDLSAQEGNNGNAYFDYMDGFGSGAYASDTYAWMWRRANGFFDVVSYFGTGSNTTISHNLGVVPEMMWVKRRYNAEDWNVYHKDLAATEYFQLNSNSGKTSSNGTLRWNSTRPTESVFSVGTHNSINASGDGYLAMLFASVDGVSKVGSYTGNGTSQTIDCGFTSGARWVLVKYVNGTGDWCVFDTTRGLVSGNDTLIFLSSPGTHYTGADDIDPHPSGFTINHDTTFGNLLNGSGSEYIFYAIA